MSEQLYVWIIGICGIVFAVAMAIQGLAGLQILRVLKPLIQKRRQLTNQSKQVVEVSENVIRDAKPRLSATATKARELANTAASRTLARKREAQELADVFRRLRRSPLAKPKGRQTPDGA